MISRFLSFLLLLYALGFALFVVLLPQPADGARTDAIVVLTGAAGRIERGLELLRQGKAEKMLVSGVNRTVRPVELADRYGNARLFDCCIDLGRESVDTRSNADETYNWLRRNKYKSVRLVTTDWHMPRAAFELSRRAEGVEVVQDAVRSKPNFRLLFAEYNKYLLRRAAVIVGI
ncbi:YdcF family protein [Allosphingosinicella indica]|uniref:Uncharacterized SAM-binding protein YcdF, DUF218 family n=1 Tax=Allosphingosinicella indica TaxID=941907 RepID=A0A1X7G4U1_9SPHN|nr:YdcF family protein [Allosphingosinicella indica]SMF63985.1 Uncharacterized SAM-binding protein YcdF, DUF218 family [Allosphingosinicella indica]